MKKFLVVRKFSLGSAKEVVIGSWGECDTLAEARLLAALLANQSGEPRWIFELHGQMSPVYDPNQGWKPDEVNSGSNTGASSSD